MVNTLQLLTHIPLFSINLPSNALNFFSLIIGISNFSIVDVESIEKRVLKMEEGDAAHSPNFKEMGYESTNAILSMGFVFIALVGSVIMIGVVLILEKIGTCCKRI